MAQDTGGADPQLLEELFEWLRIPSISSGGGDPAALRTAAEWAARRVETAGGTVDLVEGAAGKPPLVVGELRSAAVGAPTVMIYGHYDVQSPDPVDLWETPPFEPAIRDGRIYARGACDDKGNFLPLLHVACRLAAAGELPVNVRVLIEGEEETAGEAVCEWVLEDERGADAAVLFDSLMADERTPAVTVGSRGMVHMDVQVRTAERDVHSGLYGSAVLNAAHVLQRMLAEVVPGPDGVVRDELRAGVAPATDRERDAWSKLPDPAGIISEAGARPASRAALRDFYVRTTGDTAIDVHGVDTGDAHQVRTQIPSSGRAKLSVRLAPGQDPQEIAPVVTRLLEEAAPEGAEVTVRVVSTADAALVDANDPALKLAGEALEAACGVAPLYTRIGGTLPVFAAFAKRGIPTILSGFGRTDDGFHGINESYRLESLRLGELASEQLYAHLARLDRS